MELVHQPMEDGRSHDPGGDEEDQTGVESVEPGEELAAARHGRLHRTHASQEHGRVQERVTPSEVLEVGVAPHARTEREDDEGESDPRVSCEAAQEYHPRDGRHGPLLVHLRAEYRFAETTPARQAT